MQSKDKAKFTTVTPTHVNEIWDIDTMTLDSVWRPTVIFCHEHTGLPLYATEKFVCDGDAAGPLNELGAKFGYPKIIRVSKHPKLSTAALLEWATMHRVSIDLAGRNARQAADVPTPPSQS